MQAKLLLIAVLLTTVCAQDSFEDFMDNIFDTGPEQARVALAPSSTPATTKSERQTKRSCGLRKECVRRPLCSPRNTDEVESIDPRIMVDETEECPSTLDICCSVDDIITEPIVMPKDRPSGCGYRNIDGIGPRFGVTTTSEFGEFPWMLAIMRVTNYFGEDRLSFFCGGSLIHPKVALTGGHCIYETPSYTIRVRAGEWELNTETELYPHQDRQVADVILHEEYNNSNLRFNIALLFLDTPFELAPNVNTLCLPPVGYNFISARCYASGWGTDKFRNGEFSKVLKKVDLPVLPRAVCQNMLRQTRLGKYFELHWSFLCAGGERGKDTCRGDGGSPLVCPMEKTADRYYQTGIVAWGIGCFDENVPRVLTNVAELRPWIDDKLASRQINSTYFTA